VQFAPAYLLAPVRRFYVEDQGGVSVHEKMSRPGGQESTTRTHWYDRNLLEKILGWLLVFIRVDDWLGAKGIEQVLCEGFLCVGGHGGWQSEMWVEMEPILMPFIRVAE
jgi:hypothetical protein